MKVTYNQQLDDHLEALVRDFIEGRRELPAVKLTRHLEPGIMHASEGEHCPVKPYYARTLENPPPLGRRSIFLFMAGRLFERQFTTPLPPKEKDGIVGEVDGEFDGLLIEFKSTRQDMDRFNPETSQPEWIQRAKTYAYIHDVDRIGFGVWFLVGNMWTHKTENTGLKAWTLEFTPEELGENWLYMLEQRESLFRCINNGELPEEEWVKARRKDYECKGCQYAPLCPFFIRN